MAESIKEDTLRETPVAKASEPRIKLQSDEWKAPPGVSTELALRDAVDPSASGARVDLGFGDARVRTFQAKGPFAVILVTVVLLALAAIFTLVFVFAVGAGVALAAGAAVVGALGIGAARVARRLGGRKL